MPTSIESFFYDIMSQIQAKLPNSDDTVKKIKTTTARYWTIFHSPYMGNVGELDAHRRENIRYAIYNLIINSFAENSPPNDNIELNDVNTIIDNAESKIQSQNTNTNSAPPTIAMSRDNTGEPDKTDNVDNMPVARAQIMLDTYTITSQYAFALENLIHDTWGIEKISGSTNQTSNDDVRINILDDTHSATSKGQAPHEHNTQSTQRTQRNSDSCCDDGDCSICCYTTNYSYSGEYYNNYSNGGYNTTVICFNDNDCTQLCNCCGSLCGGMLHGCESLLSCSTHLCTDACSGMMQCFSGIGNCCVSDICQPTCSTIGNCDCGDCKCEGDCGKECLGCLCSPCIGIAGLFSKTTDSGHTPSHSGGHTPSHSGSHTPSPSGSITTPSPHQTSHERLLSSLSKSAQPAAKIDGCTQHMNQIAHWIDEKLKMSKVGMECSPSSTHPMHGGSRTLGSTLCCLTATTILFCHISRRCNDVQKLMCQRPDAVQRGNLNRNLASLCFISACCLSGLFECNPYHSYRTATFFGSLATWFCNRIDIALAGHENLLGCKSDNGIFGFTDVTAQIAKLKKMFTSHYSQSQWEEEVSKLVQTINGQTYNTLTKKRLDEIDEKLNSHINRVRSTEQDGCVRSLPVTLAKNCLQTTGPHNQGWFSSQHLMGRFIDCLDLLTCHKDNPSSQRLFSENTFFKMPSGQSCCGVSRSHNKPKNV